MEWAAGRVGSFLELGAYNGVDYSNTRALMLAGWQGIAVEPAPDLAEQLRANVAGYPVEVVGAAAVTAPQPTNVVTLRWTRGQPFSSLVHHEPQMVPLAVRWVLVDDLLSRLSAMPRPWLVSIDTEGTSLALLAAVLERLGLAYRAECIVVEAHANIIDERQHAETLLATYGYSNIGSNDVNVIAAV